MTRSEKVLPLKQIRLELARDHEFPNGSRERGYDLIAPLDSEGKIDAQSWKSLRDRCRVRRFWAGEEEVGHIVHKPGGSWAFHYDIRGDASHDDKGYRFADHKFVPGEYVSLTEQDGHLRTFRVTAVAELD
jgi:hypothetical protein